MQFIYVISGEYCENFASQDDIEIIAHQLDEKTMCHVVPVYTNMVKNNINIEMLLHEAEIKDLNSPEDLSKFINFLINMNSTRSIILANIPPDCAQEVSKIKEKRNDVFLAFHNKSNGETLENMVATGRKLLDKTKSDAILSSCEVTKNNNVLILPNSKYKYYNSENDLIFALADLVANYTNCVTKNREPSTNTTS